MTSCTGSIRIGMSSVWLLEVFSAAVPTLGGITPSDSTVQAVWDAPRPTGVQELRSFMGLAGWFAKFIPAYAAVSQNYILVWVSEGKILT